MLLVETDTVDRQICTDETWKQTDQNAKVSRREIPTSDAPTTTMRALSVTFTHQPIYTHTQHSLVQRDSNQPLPITDDYCCLQTVSEATSYQYNDTTITITHSGHLWT